MNHQHSPPCESVAGGFGNDVLTRGIVANGPRAVPRIASPVTRERGGVVYLRRGWTRTRLGIVLRSLWNARGFEHYPDREAGIKPGQIITRMAEAVRRGLWNTT